jgi:hypothetical protein
MKRFILLVFSILLTFTFAIAQDGINYQGAATDANGDELTNQTISLKASIISGSASGNLEWEETHSTTTDQFGLFNVVIGQGTNTTNGATATFDDMDWGSGNHFLKIEMDASGGTNYAMIGTTQMMSVPYALYAESANINYDSLANLISYLLSNDSTFITNVGGGMGGGCDIKFPEGLDGETIVHDLHLDYTVPNGKNLYINHVYLNGEQFRIDTVKHIYGYVNYRNSSRNHANNSTFNIIAGEGQVLSSEASSLGKASFIGFLVDKTSVEPISHSLGGNSNGAECILKFDV